MARKLLVSWAELEAEACRIYCVDGEDKPADTLPMTCSCAKGCSPGQHLVDQTPRYDNQVRKRRKRRRVNATQVISQAGLIRPDKRMKARYL